MNRHLPILVLVSTFAFGSGCASAPPSTQSDPSCVSSDGFLCARDLDGFPFVRHALMVSDYCVSGAGVPCSGLMPPAGATTVKMSHPAPGKLCLSGRVSQSGFAVLSLGLALTNHDGTKILEPFDAAGRGIDQVTLAIDSPPSQGAALEAHMITHRECVGSALDCFYPPNFKYKAIIAPGQVIAPLADFKSEDDPSQGLEPSVLNDVFLQVASGDYGFCIHDFNFLDAAGKTVNP